MQIFLPNLHFDDCVAGRVIHRNPAVERVVGALTPLMGLLADADDAVIVPDGYQPTDVPECLGHVQWMVASEVQRVSPNSVLVPWGWDQDARRFAEHLKSSNAIPFDEAVRHVNRRSFQAEFDIVYPNNNSLPLGTKFGRLCTTEESFSEGLTQLAVAETDSWIAKAEWTAAGRNRLLGRGTSLNAHQRNWIRRQMNSCGAVYLEPQVTVTRECSIQLDVFDASGAVRDCCRVIGVVELFADSTGRYIGSIVTDAWDQSWQPAVDYASQIAAATATAGYFGPLGIDCMLAELPNESRVLRMCHDINGRHTMGRLALSFLRSLKHGQAGFWSHSAPLNPGEVSTSTENLPAGSPVNIVDSLSTSPELIGGRPPAVRTRFVVTSSLSDARILAEWIIDQHQQNN